MDKTADRYAKWNKSDSETQVSHAVFPTCDLSIVWRQGGHESKRGLLEIWKGKAVECMNMIKVTYVHV